MALPKSRSNTRISVLTGTQHNKKSPAKVGTSNESTRLYHLASSGGGSGGPADGRPRTLGRNVPVGGPGGAGGGQGGYGSYQPLRPSSNPVEDCLRAGAAGLGWCLVAWFAGVVLLVFEYATRWGAHRGSSREKHDEAPQWLVFSPFWVGDALALLVLARIMMKVSNIRFVTPARNRGARRGGDGRVRSTGSLTELSSHGPHGGGGNGAGGGGGGGVGALTFTPITLDFFPLLQQVVASSVGAFLVLLVFTMQQVLVCLRWGRDGDAPGVPKPLVVAAPLLVVEAFFLLRVVLIRTQGWLSGLTWTLLLLLTISVALRSDADSHNDLSVALRSHPWLECLAPLWALDLLYAGVAGYVAANTIAGRFVVTPTQGLCFALLVAALAGSTLAEMLMTGDHRLHKLADKVPRVEYLRLDLPLLLVVVSILAFSVAVYLSAEHTVSMLISTHGYDDPLPLCETQNGWEWSGAGKASWGLLGDVSVRAEKKVGLPAGLAGAKGVSVASASDIYFAEAGFANKYERTDSGQYADLYDNLDQ
ncbi:unnamed protein product [Scytosiphon promiscuus]